MKTDQSKESRDGDERQARLGYTSLSTWMSKGGVLFPKSEDTRPRSRVLKRIRGMFGGPPPSKQKPSGEMPLNRWWASLATGVVISVLSFFVLANVISTAWITYLQMALASGVAGLVAMVWTFVFITNSRTLLKRGFCAGAILTLVAIIGYTFSIRIRGLSREPIEFSVVATPLEGWSILGAIVVVMFLLIGMLHERRNP